MAAVAVVVWGLDLLRCGSDAAEETGFVLRAGGAAAAPPSRCAGADVAAMFAPAGPDAGLSGTSVQGDGGGTAKSFWAEGLADLWEVVGEATCSGFCLVWDSGR